MKADVSRPTARKYLDAGQTPEELQAKRTWRTRPDPLAQIWPKAEAMLLEAPGLEAKVLFEHLWSHAPWEVGQKHLRTFQRRVKQWRLQHGPDKEVFFAQDWVPGHALQLDWTNANELGITIEDEPYPHLLCHVVLPYSNWQWATRCQSESLLSLRHGLQEGVQLPGPGDTGAAGGQLERSDAPAGHGQRTRLQPGFPFRVRALWDHPEDHRDRVSQ